MSFDTFFASSPLDLKSSHYSSYKLCRLDMHPLPHKNFTIFGKLFPSSTPDPRKFYWNTENCTFLGLCKGISLFSQIFSTFGKVKPKIFRASRQLGSKLIRNSPRPPVCRPGPLTHGQNLVGGQNFFRIS